MPACLSRPSRIDGARHAAAVIELIVTRLRHTGPDVRIIVSGDSDLARQRLNRWCGRAGFGYVIGIARHARRQGRLAAWEAALKVAYLRDGTRAAHDPRQAAQVRRSDSVYTRRVRVLLASHHPVRDADLTAVRALVPCPGRLRSRHVDASGGACHSPECPTPAQPHSARAPRSMPHRFPPFRNGRKKDPGSGSARPAGQRPSSRSRAKKKAAREAALGGAPAAGRSKTIRMTNRRRGRHAGGRKPRVHSDRRDL